VERDTEALVDRVLTFVEARDVLLPGAVVVAVSGGQDSVCMLDILNRLRERLRIELHVAHLDHMFRGAQSAAEAEYVRELAHRMNLSASIGAIDVTSFRARHRLSKQVAARYARLQFLSGVAGQLHARQIAVGHTADDAVETFLLNLVRGAGLTGLGGMSPTRDLERGQLGPMLEDGDWKTEPIPPPSERLPSIARPILELFRDDTEAYCRARGLAFRRDPSNLDMAYRRNWVRMELLPCLERGVPGVKDRLRNAADLLADDRAIVAGVVDERWNEMAKQGIGRVEFDLAGWSCLTPAIGRHLLRKSIETLTGSLEGYGRAHIDEAETVIRRGKVGARVDLPAGLILEKGYDSFWLSTAAASLPEGAVAPATPVHLTVPGSVPLQEGVLEARLIDAEDGDWSQYCSGSRWEACIDADKVRFPLIVRRREAGDRFVPLGMDRAKKLHDFLIDEKVPRRERDRLPLIATRDGIVWVVGYRMDDRFKVTLNTKRILKLSYKPVLGPES
jgi:tRNA(Ile)-lysidine synthase